jgi:uncharacterized membrane protein YagU involved in acid resistance
VIVGTAAAVHLGLSILYACILAPLLSRLHMARSLLAGVTFGALLYVVNLHGFATAVFPWMAQMRGWITLVSHLLFGLVLAYSYKMAEAAQWKSRELPRSKG